MTDEPVRFGPVGVLQIGSKLTIDGATFVMGGEASDLCNMPSPHEQRPGSFSRLRSEFATQPVRLLLKGAG